MFLDQLGRINRTPSLEMLKFPFEINHHVAVCEELWLHLSVFIFSALPNPEPMLLAT